MKRKANVLCLKKKDNIYYEQTNEVFNSFKLLIFVIVELKWEQEMNKKRLEIDQCNSLMIFFFVVVVAVCK